MSYAPRIGPLINTKFRKFVYEWAGFNRYGLHHDDLYDDELNPDVKKAVSRLPRKLYDERVYRQIRALQLSMEKTYLPKEEWVKFEEDTKYLEPYLKEVIQERKEREKYEEDHV